MLLNIKKYLLCFLTISILTSCSDSDSDLYVKLQGAVTEGEVSEHGYKIIKMTDLTDFDWETMYYFQPNDDKKTISDAIGFKWDGKPVDIGTHRLLFVSNKQVISYMDYEYSEFPLFVYGCDKDRWVYPKSRSEFATFKYCNGDKETFAFIPVQCVDNISSLMEYKCSGTKAGE